jgi:hypothetical protein
MHVGEGEERRLRGRNNLVAQLGEPGEERPPNHGVLRAILRVREQRRRERGILVGGRPPRCRPGEAARANVFPVQPNEALGARSDERAGTAPAPEHVAIGVRRP